VNFYETIAAEVLTEKIADYRLKFENSLICRCLNQISANVVDIEGLTCSEIDDAVIESRVKQNPVELFVIGLGSYFVGISARRILQ
jgi:hypothetical protein